MKMEDLFWRQIQNFSVRLKSKQTPEIKIEIEKMQEIQLFNNVCFTYQCSEPSGYCQNLNKKFLITIAQ